MARRRRQTGRKAPVPGRPLSGAITRPPAAQLGFAPFKPPTSPPPGTYDPALDAQLGQAKRGYGDLDADIRKANARSEDDYRIAQGEIGRRRSEGLADIVRGYTRLGNRQRQSAIAAGVSEGGALTQALAKREENKSRDDTRLNESADRQLGDLALRYYRGTEDRTEQLSRAGRELGFYGQDIGASRFYQAAQGNFPVDTGPENERQGPGGPYRVERGVWRHPPGSLPHQVTVYANPNGETFLAPPGTRGPFGATPIPAGEISRTRPWAPRRPARPRRR